MTVSSAPRSAGPYLGDGVNTTFPFAFKVFTGGDATLAIIDPSGALVYPPTSQYIVTLNIDQDASPGGSISYPIGGPPILPLGWQLSVIGNLPYDQTLDLPPGGNFNPIALENALDRTVMLVQQLFSVVQGAPPPPGGSQGNFLALTGGVMTGPISSTVGDPLRLETAANAIVGWYTAGALEAFVQHTAGGSMVLHGLTTAGLEIPGVGVQLSVLPALVPLPDNALHLGTPANRWLSLNVSGAGPFGGTLQVSGKLSSTLPGEAIQLEGLNAVVGWYTAGALEAFVQHTSSGVLVAHGKNSITLEIGSTGEKVVLNANGGLTPGLAGGGDLGSATTWWDRLYNNFTGYIESGALTGAVNSNIGGGYGLALQAILGGISLATGGFSRLIINAAGNVVISAPLSGSVLSLNTQTTAPAINLVAAAGLNTQWFDGVGSTTGFQYGQFTNGAGRMWIGINGSVAGALLQGSQAYATCLGSMENMDLSLGTSAIERLRIRGVGDVVIVVRNVYAPATARAGEMIFSLVSDTSLRISVRGYDGTERSTLLPLS